MKENHLQQLGPHDEEHDKSRDKATCRTCLVVLLAVSLPTMLLLSTDAGISADEGRHQQQAEKVFNYYASGGKDKAALKHSGIDPMHYNGQSVDNATYLVSRVFRLGYSYRLRHLVNVVIGWLCVLFAALLGKMLDGYRAAFLTAILLLATPFFLGHSYNNSMDVPFALGYVWTLYAIFRYLRELPRPSRFTIGLLVSGVAFTISIRIAGLLLIAQLHLFTLAFLVHRKGFEGVFGNGNRKETAACFARLFVVSAIGYLLGIAFWPFLLEAPLRHGLLVLGALRQHPLAIRQLFEGRFCMSNEMPRYYAAKYALITYPLAVLTGLFLFSVVALSGRNCRERRLHFGLLTFSFLFPLVWVMIRNSNIWGGIRHLLFIYPPVVAAAAVGYAVAFRSIPARFRILGPIAFGLLCLHPILHTIRNHPLEYVYFNEISGGVAAAYGRYETDYFQHSMRPATEWLGEYIAREDANRGRKIRVVANDMQIKHFFGAVEDLVETQYSRYGERSMKPWDYAIFTSAYISPHQLTHRYWPPRETLHTVKVNGVPVCAVVRRVSDEDCKGFEALGNNAPNDAVPHFERYLAVDPGNDVVWLGLAEAQLARHDAEAAEVAATRAAQIRPGYSRIEMVQGRVLLARQRWGEAGELFSGLAQRTRGDPNAHYGAAVAFFQNGEYRKAIQHARFAAQRAPQLQLARDLEVEAERMWRAKIGQQLQGRSSHPDDASRRAKQADK